MPVLKVQGAVANPAVKKLKSRGIFYVNSDSRMKLMRVLTMLFTFLGVAALSGCGSFATTEGYEQRMNTWIGAPESSLIAAWGLPDKNYASGNVRYIAYISSRTIEGSEPTYKTTCTSDPNGVAPPICKTKSYGGTSSYTAYCETTFHLVNRYIKNYSFKGNDCRAKPISSP